MKSYDLEERTSAFSEEIIDFVQKLPRNPINNPLVSQIVRSATSIGANYAEAFQTLTTKDLSNKLVICKKEANETKYWLRMISRANKNYSENCRTLWRKAHEFVLMFSKGVSSTQKNLNLKP